MKIFVLFLVLMMVGSCLAASRRAKFLGGMYGQQQRFRVEKGKSIESSSMERMSHVMYPERNFNNHHSIPRQHYNNGSGTSQGDDPDNNESETAQP